MRTQQVLGVVGNKAKGRISKRVLQESKSGQIFQKTNIYLPPDTHVRIRGKEIIAFRKIWRDLLSSNTRLEICSFTLLPTE